MPGARSTCRAHANPGRTRARPRTLGIFTSGWSAVRSRRYRVHAHRTRERRCLQDKERARKAKMTSEQARHAARRGTCCSLHLARRISCVACRLLHAVGVAVASRRAAWLTLMAVASVVVNAARCMSSLVCCVVHTVSCRRGLSAISSNRTSPHATRPRRRRPRRPPPCTLIPPSSQHPPRPQQRPRRQPSSRLTRRHRSAWPRRWPM